MGEPEQHPNVNIYPELAGGLFLTFWFRTNICFQTFSFLVFVVLTLVQCACIFFSVQILQFGFWTNMLSNIFQFHLARNVSTHSCVIQLLIEQFHVNGTIIKPSASKLHCNLAFGTCCEIIIRCFKMLLQQNIHAI